MTRHAQTVKPMKSAAKAKTKKAPPKAAKKTAEPSSSDYSARASSKDTSSAGAGDSASGSRPVLRTEQLGATLAKGLDLAEAGLSLGLTLMTRFGSIVQETVLEKVAENFSAAMSPAPTGESQEARAGTAPVPSSVAESEAAPAHDLSYSITNRLPLFPGHAVRVSFSINNDSEEIAKRVKLRVEGFVGQISAVHVPIDGFSVKPSSSAIAPMDFEKFVLSGTLPQDIPSDLYLGKVVVVSDQNLEIPVRLIVGPPTP